jgi:hypothetical protein
VQRMHVEAGMDCTFPISQSHAIFGHPFIQILSTRPYYLFPHAVISAIDIYHCFTLSLLSLPVCLLPSFCLNVFLRSVVCCCFCLQLPLPAISHHLILLETSKFFRCFLRCYFTTPFYLIRLYAAA